MFTSSRKLFFSLLAILLSSIVSPFAWAAKSASSLNISANPSISLFQDVAAGSISPGQSTEIKNIGNSALTLGTLAVSGLQADQFSIATDACSGQILALGETCRVDIHFAPTTAGHKQALLSIPSDSTDTPLLQTFLTNYEDLDKEASRRLPPVLYSLSVPETMVSGTTYTLEWSLLGYHEDYLTYLAMFDCTGITDGSCGTNYSASNRFFEKLELVAETTLDTDWGYEGLLAKEFKFKTQFTPNFNEQTDIVIRFYQKNTDDKEAGLGSLSLVIPGNLSGNYYDK